MICDFSIFFYIVDQEASFHCLRLPGWKSGQYFFAWLPELSLAEFSVVIFYD